jgi:hypothetical protein
MRSLFKACAFATLIAGVTAQERLYPGGVTAEVDSAIQRGLAWLARQQGNDGSWRESGGYGTYPAAMTGLSGMALVAAGSTPTRGQYWREVRRSTDFLLRCANSSNGLISVPSEEPHTMYGHGFATLYLASIYGTEEDLRTQIRLKGALDRAVELIGSAQSANGGWYYQPGMTSDEGSVTVTQLQALRACRMAGIVVDKRTVDRATDYLRRSQNADGGLRYSLTMSAGGDSRPAITAAGVVVFYSAGVYEDQPFVEKAFRYCQSHIDATIGTGQHDYYTHLYWSQALYQRGGSAWSDYYGKRAAWLLKQQRKDGSWSGEGVGNIYGTAVALTTLQLPYSLAPIYQR